MVCSIIKGRLEKEGKTKRIFATNEAEVVIIEQKPLVTAGDDPRRTQPFETKDILATKIATNVFRLLDLAGLPVAFIPTVMLPANQMLSQRCDMIQLEIVGRRLVFEDSSYLKRYPETKVGTRFNEPLIELFLKTTHGSLTINNETIVEGLDPLNGEEDPLILNPDAEIWQLFRPKKPISDLSAYLQRQVIPAKIFPPNLVFGQKIIPEIVQLACRVFLILEYAWGKLGYQLIDLKIEVGVNSYGQIVVADDITNDSWRLHDPAGQEKSKELFRKDGLTDEFIAAYQLIAKLTESFNSISIEELKKISK